MAKTTIQKLMMDREDATVLSGLLLKALDIDTCDSITVAMDAAQNDEPDGFTVQEVYGVDAFISPEATQ